MVNTVIYLFPRNRQLSSVSLRRYRLGIKTNCSARPACASSFYFRSAVKSVPLNWLGSNSALQWTATPLTNLAVSFIGVQNE